MAPKSEALLWVRILTSCGHCPSVYVCVSVCCRGAEIPANVVQQPGLPSTLSTAVFGLHLSGHSLGDCFFSTT